MARLALVLSPHLDDAVLSCPVFMQRLIAGGCKVHVAAIFSSSGRRDSEHYASRRKEDREALRLLGASWSQLRFLDAPYRSARYRSFSQIIFGTDPGYQRTVLGVAAALRRMERRFRPALVLAPLAVGNHVDHRIVRAASLLAIPYSKLLFYEDKPYAFIGEQIAHVLGEPIAAQPAHFWRDYQRFCYIRRYTTSAERRSLRRNWREVAPFPGTQTPRLVQALRTRPFELQQTISAIERYRTQFDHLFESPESARVLYRTTAERYYALEGSLHRSAASVLSAAR